jgi:synaptosomal-associated protein 25
MQSSNKNGGQGNEELSGIQRQMNQTTDASLESTRRMLGLVVESQEIGVNTVVMLDEQGERLNQLEVRVFF